MSQPAPQTDLSVPDVAGVRPSIVLAIWTLAKREMLRFVRQRSRFVGALAQPVMFWVLFGAGLRGSFQAPDWAAEGMSYQEYFFPGIAVLILMFTAIFSSISIIEDRHEGFLQGVLVSPVSRLGLVLGKLTGGTMLAMLQAIGFLVLGGILASSGIAPSMSIDVTPLSAVGLILFMTLVAFSLSALGFMIAWHFDSVQGFHAIMSIFLMPMWLVSGAFFPGEGSSVLSWIIRVNPLTYGVAGIRRLLYAGGDTVADQGLPSLTVCMLATSFFGGVCVFGAIWLSGRSVAKQRVISKKT